MLRFGQERKEKRIKLQLLRQFALYYDQDRSMASGGSTKWPSASLSQKPSFSSLAIEWETASPIAPPFVQTAPQADIIPDFYLPVNAEAELTLYTFNSYEGTAYFRIYGIAEETTEGFFACDASGELLRPYTPVDTDRDRALTVAPSEFIPIAPKAMPDYYLNINLLGTEETVDVLDALSFRPVRVGLMASATEYIVAVPVSTANVFTFIDINGVQQYRVYGMIDGVEGWFASDENGVVTNTTPLDLAEEMANLTTDSPLISSRGLRIFAFDSATPTPDVLPVYYEVFHAGDDLIVYGFEDQLHDQPEAGKRLCLLWTGGPVHPGRIACDE